MRRCRKDGQKGERWLNRKVQAAVKDAVVAFCGTKNDERLWANFAWKCGYGLLLEAVYQGEAELAEHETEIPNCDKPKVLQTILNRWWQRRSRADSQMRKTVRPLFSNEKGVGR